MDVTPLIRRDAKVIQSYANGVFKISNENYERSVFVLSDSVLESGLTSDLSVDAFAPLKDKDVEVVLVGLPQRPAQPYTQLRAAVKQKYGFSLDIMELGAACRTYNVLMAEGRRVTAALVK